MFKYLWIIILLIVSTIYARFMYKAIVEFIEKPKATLKDMSKYMIISDFIDFLAGDHEMLFIVTAGIGAVIFILLLTIFIASIFVFFGGDL